MCLVFFVFDINDQTSQESVAVTPVIMANDVTSQISDHQSVETGSLTWATGFREGFYFD